MSDAVAPWVLIRTDTFLRELRKYLRKHPDRQSLVQSTLLALVDDPYAPTLRLHPLQGRLQGLHAVRLSYGDRIILTLVVNERQIVLLSLGTYADGWEAGRGGDSAAHPLPIRVQSARR